MAEEKAVSGNERGNGIRGLTHGGRKAVSGNERDSDDDGCCWAT